MVSRPPTQTFVRAQAAGGNERPDALARHGVLSIAPARLMDLLPQVPRCRQLPEMVREVEAQSVAAK